MGKKPARRKGARRLNITPELKADIRRRYEHTPERLGTMAAECGCCGETVRAMARREGWVRYEPPPRDLSPAARLRMKAERLAEQGGGAFSLPPRSGGEGRPPELAQQAQADGVGGVEGVQAPPTPDPSPQSKSGSPDFDHWRTPNSGKPEFGCAARMGGGEKGATPLTSEQSAGTAPDPAAIAAGLLQEVRGYLDDIRAKRKRMKREGYAKHELQETSRVIADCSAALQRLQLTAQRAAAAGNAQQTDPETTYDDVPADLDEFRNELARRIEAFFAARPDAGDAAGADADGSAAPSS